MNNKRQNNKRADQTARMRRLICAFVVRIWQNRVFSWRGSVKDLRANASESAWFHEDFRERLCKVGVLLHLYRPRVTGFPYILSRSFCYQVHIGASLQYYSVQNSSPIIEYKAILRHGLFHSSDIFMGGSLVPVWKGFYMVFHTRFINTVIQDTKPYLLKHNAYC